MSQFETFEDAIKAYLDYQAKQDPVFAAKLDNPKKSIEECVRFIQGEIFHKFVKDGKGKRVAVAAPSRQECFGLAMHYYDEEEIKVRDMPGVVSAGTAGPGAVPLSEEDKEKAKQKAIERLAEEEARKIKAEEDKKRQKAKEKREKDEEAGILFLFGEEDESAK